ncbi:MAG: TlpA family protein disulfide reductase [Bacteroidota bacterium]
MSKKRNTFFLIAILFALTSLNKTNAQDDAGKDIYIYEYREPYFEIPVYIDTVFAGQDFTFTPEAENTRCYYFNYGPYQCHFFARPEKEYIIKLPDISNTDNNWKKDPYFKLLPLHAKVSVRNVKNENSDLNKAIREFEEEYQPFLSKQTLRYFQPEYARAQLDSFISINYQTYRARDSETEYFFQYKRYKKAILLYHLKKQNLDTLITKYLANDPVQFEIPSYRTFFSLVLGNYFEYLSRKEQFNTIYAEFNKLSFDYLDEYLSQDPLLQNDTIRHLVMLKECYNAFFSDKMAKKRLIEFTDTVYHHSDIEIVRLSAKALKRKFTRLQEGFPAPVFSAITVTNDSLNMNGNYDKLIYLGFCDLQSIKCLQEIEYLKYLGEKHGRFITIIAVLKASDGSQLEKISAEGGENLIVVPWEKNEEIARIFDVRATPVFYLIDKKGKMLRNPAPLPSENFEYILFRILRSRGEV